MKTTRTLTAAALVCSMFATASPADTFLKYGEVEDWNVFIDQEKKSCLLETIDSEENVVQMGLTADRGVGYLGVFTKAETALKAGETEAVVILIGENMYIGEATGMRGNITKGYSGGYVLSDSPQFAEDLAQQYTMTVFPEKDYAFSIDLSGTKKAMAMARECNEKQISG